jgi:hypothetical protein
MNLEELCSWLSHQKGMMAQTYAKDLAKYIVRTKEPQIKELSDEEIDECVEKIAKEDDFYPEEIPSDKFLKCFARAILKKASEK